MSWDHPSGHALKDLIERERMYPITILSNLTKSQKSKLLTEGIVTCEQLMNQSDKLDQLDLGKSRTALTKELAALAEI